MILNHSKYCLKKHTHFVSNILLISGRGRSFALPALGSPGYISLTLLPENTSVITYIFFSFFTHNFVCKNWPVIVYSILIPILEKPLLEGFLILKMNCEN